MNAPPPSASNSLERPRVNPRSGDVPRWVFELRQLCAQLGANATLEGAAVVVTVGGTSLRLTEFREHLLVHVALLEGSRWRSVGLLSVPRADLPGFLADTLPARNG
jgi:hypothetical protein